MRCPRLCCDSSGEFLEIDIRYISENYNVVFHHQRKQMQLNTSETHTQNRLSGFEVLRSQRVKHQIEKGFQNKEMSTGSPRKSCLKRHL